MPLKLLFLGLFLSVANAALISPLAAQSQTSLARDASQAAQTPTETLTAGELRAEIYDSGQAGPQAVGSSAFASIKIKMNGTFEAPKGKNKKRSKTPAGPGPIIELEAPSGEISNITGENVTPALSGSSATAQIARLQPGEETTVLVEMRLKAPAGEQINALKITLKDPNGAASNTAELKWMARDCAGDYYRELQMIAASGGTQLSKLLTELRSPDKSLPRASLFRTTTPASSGGGRCVRYKRRWDPYESGYRRVCVRYKGGENIEETASTEVSSKDEREILQRAGAFLRSGGADPKLARNGSLEWVTGKVASDLRGYLEQPAHPALCTGAKQFTDYYLKQSAGLKSHAESIINLAAKSRELAADKVARAKEDIEQLAAGHPGAGMAPLPISERAKEEGLKQLILALAQYAGLSPESKEALSQSTDELGMLKVMKDALDAKGEDDKVMAKVVRSGLAFVEAAVHLTIAEGKYQAVKTKFIGGFENIRAAHDKFCVCGG